MTGQKENHVSTYASQHISRRVLAEGADQETVLDLLTRLRNAESARDVAAEPVRLAKAAARARGEYDDQRGTEAFEEFDAAALEVVSRYRALLALTAEPRTLGALGLEALDAEIAAAYPDALHPDDPRLAAFATFDSTEGREEGPDGDEVTRLRRFGAIDDPEPNRDWEGGYQAATESMLDAADPA